MHEVREASWHCSSMLFEQLHWGYFIACLALSTPQSANTVSLWPLSTTQEKQCHLFKLKLVSSNYFIPQDDSIIFHLFVFLALFSYGVHPDVWQLLSAGRAGLLQQQQHAVRVSGHASEADVRVLLNEQRRLLGRVPGAPYNRVHFASFVWTGFSTCAAPEEEPSTLGFLTVACAVLAGLLT